MDRNSWALCPFQSIFPRVSFLAFPSTHRVTLIATSYWERSKRKMFNETSELVPCRYDRNSHESSIPVCTEISPALWCPPAFAASLVGHWICVPRRLQLKHLTESSALDLSLKTSLTRCGIRRKACDANCWQHCSTMDVTQKALVHFVLILREGGWLGFATSSSTFVFFFFFLKSFPKGHMTAVRVGLWSQEGDLSIPVVTGGLFYYFVLEFFFNLVWGGIVTEWCSCALCSLAGLSSQLDLWVM